MTRPQPTAASHKTLTAIAVGAIAMCAGCTSTQAAPAAGPRAPAPAPAMDLSRIAGEYPTPPTLTDAGQTDAPVGGCVSPGGTPTQATLHLAGCTSPQATYRVVQRVITPDQCVPDRDRPFYFNDGHTEWTACMDINWDPTYCINLDAVVTKVACDDPNAHNKIKATQLLLDTTAVDGCTASGYAHPTRRYTICTDTQK